ncbi:cytidyltransferase domain protein [Ancylostoma caninum]|uniref:choline-phosphate cytidylyltransferase n=1 Tax=Ancylostoma caninum TaxID=29170 RepID=A0A368EWE6_ANCCA|nr:cytidyltransferase domain protein [Ancylostoma caninum]
MTETSGGLFSVPQNRPIHIFAEGVYDLFHYGHARQLRQVKEAFPNVIVTAGLCSDELVIKNKGGPLVMTYEERLASVKECRYVDNVIDHGMFYPTIELLDRIEVRFVFLEYSLKKLDFSGLRPSEQRGWCRRRVSLAVCHLFTLASSLIVRAREARTTRRAHTEIMHF